MEKDEARNLLFYS